MTGYQFSVNGSAKDYNRPQKYYSLQMFLRILGNIFTLRPLYRVGQLYCFIFVAGLLLSLFLPAASSYALEKDSDGMECQYDPKTQNLGFFKFEKSVESSRLSTFFDPHIKITYRTYGSFLGIGGWGLIQDESVDLVHAECSFMIGLRFCARYAIGANGLLPDGTRKEDADYGYDPGDRNNPHGTCVSPFRANRGPDSPTLWSDSYYHEPVRLCGYEDSKDGMDTEDDFSPFHKNTPNEGGMGEKAQEGFAIAGLAGGITVMALGILGAGLGVILILAMAGAAALTAAITSHFNHFVMAFTPGTSLGCVDIPLPPMPPSYYYQLESLPPLPYIYPVTDDPAFWASYVDEQPKNIIQDITNPKHPDNWRYLENKDWFYPKIGIALGDPTFVLENGKRVLKDEPVPVRATAILTGDFYGEGPGPNYGTETAGQGRFAPLAPLSKPNLGSTGTTQIRTVKGITAGDPLRIRLAGTEDRWVGYDVTTEVYDDKVCAYVINATWNIRPTPEGGPTPPTLSEEPEFIGCVDRPETYVKLDGTLEKAPPLPQVYHPWEVPPGSLTASDAAVSTYSNIRVWEWLRDDPRHPTIAGGIPDYGSYHTDGVSEDSAKAMAAFAFANKLGVPAGNTNPTAQTIDGGPVLALVPKLGCDSLSVPGVHEGDPGDYFKKGKHRLSRIHGKVYCMNNLDENGNNIIEPTEDTMCAQGLSANSIGETLQIIKNPKIPDRYIPVTYPVDVVVKIPSDPYTEIPNTKDFEGTFYTLPAGTDINTLSPDGNYRYQTRIFSADRTMGCPMEITAPVTVPGTDTQGQTITIKTSDIIPAVTDCPDRQDVSGTMMFYRPFDDKRGEVVMDVEGKTKLMKRVDKDGQPPNQFITKYPMFYYPRSITTSSGTVVTSNNVDPVVGECPLNLQDDGISLWQEMEKNKICLLNPDGTPDETTVPSSPYQNVPIASRYYFPPDFNRGEALILQTSLEQGLAMGYCIAMPPSQCPAEGEGTSRPLTAGAPSTVFWGTAVGGEGCTASGAVGCVDGKGKGGGRCATGYGVNGNPDGTPLRYCASNVGVFSSEGTWGSVDPTASCERLTCDSPNNFSVTKSGVTYACSITASANADDGSGNLNGTYREMTCNSTSPASTLQRRKYCDTKGNWEGWTYDSIQTGKQDCICDVGASGCPAGCTP